jgi:hypothetical protein
VRAALHAGVEQEKQDKLKPRVLEALKYLRDYGPKVRSELCWAERRVHVLLEASEPLGVSLPQLKPLLEAMSRSRRLLEKGSQTIASLHRDLSKHRGNVWRLSFVTALFAEWWLLTAKDPKASPGPCQDFICAAWCSLSPVAVFFRGADAYKRVINDAADLRAVSRPLAFADIDSNERHIFSPAPVGFSSRRQAPQTRRARAT